MKTAQEGGVAIVTGAAGGLGTAFANQLAARGYRLLLADRREKELGQVCESISTRHGVEVEGCVVDFSRQDEVENLAVRLERKDDVALLVNNAGFGTIDYFVDTDTKSLVDMALVHVAAPTRLTRAVLPGMIERNSGAVINVSSVAAWFQSACNVQYGATKCYLAAFSLALAQELRGTNVRVQALCPGFVRTEFHAAEHMRGFQRRCAPAAQFWMAADDVAKCSLRNLASKRVVVIPGLTYRVLGRLAQMPVLRPLFQWATWGPRVVAGGEPLDHPAPAVETRPAPAFREAAVPESVGASS